jgi:hypothetical protein
VTIGILPEDALLEMFGFYVDEAQVVKEAQTEDEAQAMDKAREIEKWHTLVHVCRRWRYVVFASPRRLKLRLLCTDRRPVREMLCIWPGTLPIVIWSNHRPISLMDGVDNIIAALEHPDRVCRIDLRSVPSSLLERLADLMQRPFPALEYLELRTENEATPDVSDSFLGGPAPHLRSLLLKSVPFPALQKLVLSASHLVRLNLWNTPHTLYTTPEAMIACLSSLPKLETLRLGFRSPRPHLNLTNGPSPQTRAELPFLTSLTFLGESEYLEDLVAWITAPLLNTVKITFFDQPIFHISHLPLFINRAEKLNALNQADLMLDSRSVAATLSPRPRETNCSVLRLEISSTESDWQLSSLVQVCRQSLPTLSTLKRLDIREGQYPRPRWQDNNEEDAHWLVLLQLFTAVEDLHLSKRLALHVVPALQELAEERVAVVLPALQNVFVEKLPPTGIIRRAIKQFAAARQRLDRPITIKRWKRE